MEKASTFIGDTFWWVSISSENTWRTTHQELLRDMVWRHYWLHFTAAHVTCNCEGIYRCMCIVRRLFALPCISFVKFCALQQRMWHQNRSMKPRCTIFQQSSDMLALIRFLLLEAFSRTPKNRMKSSEGVLSSQCNLSLDHSWTMCSMSTEKRNFVAVEIFFESD